MSILSVEYAEKCKEWERERLYKEALEQGIEQGLHKGIQQGIQQGMHKGLEQGMQQGIEQGLKKGLLQNAHDNAVRMLNSKKLSIPDISLYTGLPVNEVQKIAASIS